MGKRLLLTAVLMWSWAGCYEIEPLDADYIDEDNQTETESAPDALPESGCQMTTQTFALAGTIEYDEFQGGKIGLYINEEISKECGETEASQRVILPGYRVGQISLASPGTFETTVTVSHIQGEPPPMLSILAIHNKTETIDDWEACEAGQVLEVDPENHSSLNIELAIGFCPVRN